MAKVRDDRPVYIYLLRSPVDGAVRYVGKSVDIENRFRAHLWEAARGRNGYRSNWVRKLLTEGLQPILEIIEKASAETWVERERFWIAFYRSRGADLVNVTQGGEGTAGRPTSDETRLKIGAAQKGKRMRPETIARRVATLKALHSAIEVDVDDAASERCDYMLLSPDGEEIAVRNLAAFCAKRGFSQGLFSSVLRGKRQHAYQWRIRRADDPPFEPLAGSLNAYRRGGLDFILRSFDGEEILVHNLSEFCRDRGLGEKSLRSAIDRPGKTSQGWQIRRPDGPAFAPPSKPGRVHKRRDAEYLITDRRGTVYRVRNIRQFCQENGLKQWWFHDMLRGRRDNYEGWRIQHPGDARNES